MRWHAADGAATTVADLPCATYQRPTGGGNA